MTARRIERMMVGACLACLDGFGWSAASQRCRPVQSSLVGLASKATDGFSVLAVGERPLVEVHCVNLGERPSRVVGVGRCCGRHACHQG